jgi:hypothetical protein
VIFRVCGAVEDLGNGLGLTDPVSGELVVDRKAWTAADCERS